MSKKPAGFRNVALCGHRGTGKTTLLEQLCLRAGVIPKAETIESGHTISDFHTVEIAHQSSIHTSLASLDWQDTYVNVLDTPGAADFVGEVIAGIRVAETVVMVVSAPAGIQIETVKLWRRLNTRNLPRIVFINKMDMDMADFHKSVNEIKEAFDVTVVPLNLPLGQAKTHEGIIDILHMKAIKAGGEEVPIPENMNQEVNKWRAKLVEMAAEGDDELTEKFFDNGTLEGEDIIKGLVEGMAGNTFVPVLCGSALQGSGIKDLLDILVELCPPPGREPEPLADGSSVPYGEGEVFSGFVFKTSIDKFAGKISYVKVVSGYLEPGEIHNSRTNEKERINKVFHIHGGQLKETAKLSPGDLGGVVKLNSIQTNDSIFAGISEKHFKALALPSPIFSLAINSENQKDEDKMNDYLHRIAHQDLTFRIKFNEETRENVISGMGEMHLNIILENLLQDSKISVKNREPGVAYRETITKTAESEYTHKKQTGGHGQFGKISIKIYPLERGQVFELSNNIKGGAISKGYLLGIEKGLLEAMQEGFLASYPMVDVGVSVFDGKEHPVDSSEMAFKLAAKNALKIGFEKCGAKLLEPMVNLSIFVEDNYLGDILSDLSSKRGRVLDQQPIGGGIQSVKALVPEGELLTYAIDMKSLTSGTGSYELAFSHYETVSGKTAQEIIKAREDQNKE